MFNKIFVSMFFVLLHLGVSAQVKDSVFYFVVGDSIDNNAIGEEYAYNYHRQYLNDSVFCEVGLFTRKTSFVYEFMIENGDWYFRHSDKWQPFFVKSRGYNVRFNINGIVFTTTWSNPGVFRGMKSFILTLVPPKNMSISHMPQYIFNPEFGFIAIKNEVTLIRKDIQFLEE